MIEILNSRRMTVVIVVLIIICSIVVIIEEWFTNSQLVISSILTPTFGETNQHLIPGKGSDHNNNIANNLPLSPKPIVPQEEKQSHSYSQQSSNNTLVQQLQQQQLLQFQLQLEHTHWKQFLSFLSLCSFFGGLSGLFVKYRQLQNRNRTLARFRKQNDDECSDESNHTLINMNNLM